MKRHLISLAAGALALAALTGAGAAQDLTTAQLAEQQSKVKIASGVIALGRVEKDPMMLVVGARILSELDLPVADPASEAKGASKAYDVARILAEEGLHERLMDYAEQVQSLDLLQEFAPYLIDNHRERLLELYRKLLTDFLRNHLGRKTSQRIREALQRLHEIGAGNMAVLLVEEFRSQYPERHSLMEELALF